MAGLLPNNPFSQWVDPRRNALMGFSAGMLSGDPGAAMRYAMQGSGIDREAAMQAQQQAQAEQERNATLEWVKQNAPQFANLPPAMAFEAAMKQLQQAQAGAKEPLEINGQLVDPNTYKVLGDYRTQENSKPLTPPSGYRFTPDGGALEAIPGGPNDPANRPPPAMNSTIQKELFEADESIQAGQSVMQALDRAKELNMQSGEGPLADIFSQGGALFGDAQSVNTQELKNLVTAQALEQLKAVFGSMPTEGERKILLEIQGSVNQSKAVRERIFERARQAVERRVVFNADKAKALRSGQYFDEGFTPTYGGTAPASGANVDDILTKYGL